LKLPKEKASVEIIVLMLHPSVYCFEIRRVGLISLTARITVLYRVKRRTIVTPFYALVGEVGYNDWPSTRIEYKLEYL
jgi:hypothetical protein